MSEYLAIIAPGVIAAILYRCNLKEKISWKKFLIILCGFIFGSNILSYLGLAVIGIRDLKLSEMGTSFKIKYFILSLMISAVFISVWKLLNKERRQEAICNIKAAFPGMFFFVITFCIFMPSSLFLGNIKEFFISFGSVFWVILIMSLMFAAGILIMAVVLPEKRVAEHYAAFIFSIAFCLYMQGNFLNSELPELDGMQIEWEKYSTITIISTCFWLVFVIGLQILMWYVRNKKSGLFKKVTVKSTLVVLSCAAYFLSAVQIVTLGVLLFTADKPMTTEVVITKEDEFSVGTDNNIIVFILDAFESKAFEDVIIADTQYESGLQDFTFYPNAVSGGAYTKAALPLLLTGIEYDPAFTTHDEYLVEAWTTTELYDDLSDSGFDVRIFTDSHYITHVTEDAIDNVRAVGKDYYISGYYDFARDLYKFTCFYSMPYPLKQLFWFYGGDAFDTVQAPQTADDELTADFSADEGYQYRFDDVLYYNELKAAEGLDVKYKNAFRIYHLVGAHAPYTMNENMERVSEEETSHVRQMQGAVNIVFTYIDALKHAGLYDKSTIIITADHGGPEYRGIEQNPAFLIKEANAEHELEINEAPIHFRNVVASIARAAMTEYTAYGPSVYDIDENSDVERLHTVKDGIAKKEFPDIEYPLLYGRFIIPADARDVDGIIYHDVYSLNRFAYKLGEDIRFSADNVYAPNINYRLYQENGTGIASTELTLCFELEDYKRRDVELAFCYQDVYNDLQKIRIYARGQKITDMLCTKEDAGIEKSIVIPADCIEDNLLVIRMVFPNAVTPHQLDASNPDTRVLSVAFESMCLRQ